ncbi:helix-turn-helix domain-containing protein [Corynebacterium ulceribovis]|uniref:helix-turn-helix domain-containing protein n=1 Tax=Corynebacterium ulceribovis TaxID=487732 RepID=UPI0003816B74
MPQTKTNTYLTAAMVAERWETTERHVYRLMARGQLRCSNLGGVKRVHRDDLAEFESAARGER